MATYAPACLCLFCLSFKTQPKTANDQSEVGERGAWALLTNLTHGKTFKHLRGYIFNRKTKVQFFFSWSEMVEEV